VDKEVKYELPKDWKWIKLGEVGKIETGTTPDKSNIEYYGNEIPFYKPTDLKQGINTIYASDNLSKKGFEKTRKLPKDSILVTCIGATIGKTGLIKKEGASNQQINSIIPDNQHNPKFIFYQIISQNFQNQIKLNASSTTLPILNKSKFAQLNFITTRLTLQQLVVSNIEELFSELDKGTENLRIAQQQLKTYRQAVLKYAFEGKLTNENLKDGKMPKGWKNVKLDTVGKLFCGQSSKVSEVNCFGEGTLYVTGPEQWNGKHINEKKWTINPKRIVPDGTIFITVKGAGIGKMFPGISCAIGRDVYAYLPSNILNFKFTFYALKHSIDLVIAKAQGDIPGLAKHHILEHEIGICSIAEQNKIVQIIESRLSVADKMEESINQSLQQAEALRQSILKKAFEGRLI